MFVKVTNGTAETYTIGQLRRDNPNTSFPKDIPTETLASFNVYAVVSKQAPQIDHNTHRLTQSVQLVDGAWTQVWSVVQLPEEQAIANVRGVRDGLLAESDWTQVADAPVDQAAWATYRQALRDVPQQEGFPHNVTWPTKP